MLFFAAIISLLSNYFLMTESKNETNPSNETRTGRSIMQTLLKSLGMMAAGVVAAGFADEVVGIMEIPTTSSNK